MSIVFSNCEIVLFQIEYIVIFYLLHNQEDENEYPHENPAKNPHIAVRARFPVLAEIEQAIRKEQIQDHKNKMSKQKIIIAGIKKR